MGHGFEGGDGYLGPKACARGSVVPPGPGSFFPPCPALNALGYFRDAAPGLRLAAIEVCSRGRGLPRAIPFPTHW